MGLGRHFQIIFRGWSTVDRPHVSPTGGSRDGSSRPTTPMLGTGPDAQDAPGSGRSLASDVHEPGLRPTRRSIDLLVSGVEGDEGLLDVREARVLTLSEGSRVDVQANSCQSERVLLVAVGGGRLLLLQRWRQECIGLRPPVSPYCREVRRDRRLGRWLRSTGRGCRASPNGQAERCCNACGSQLAPHSASLTVEGPSSSPRYGDQGAVKPARFSCHETPKRSSTQANRGLNP